jgi:hypothetical protein
MNPDTPRTDASRLAEAEDLIKRGHDGWQKAEEEVAKLNHQLLKTESDLLQSQDINSFLDVEFRIACKRAERAEAEVERLLERAENAEADLIRTQIEMQLEIDKAEAEVERLKKELADWAYGTRAKREQERAEKAEAEVERLKEQLESTKLLAVKFWNVLEENGFKIELPK